MSGIRLQPGELAHVAGLYNLTEAHVRTVIDVETSGKGFETAGQVKFLFEPHKFYVNVPKSKQAQAIKQGLAYKFWKGPGSYPKTPALRWAQFQKACALDETAAIKSASWGLGQIMGSEYAEAGYDSPQHMFVEFAKSEIEQVKGMLSLIKKRGLDKDLRNFPDMEACRHFALRYNGAAYAKNNYHNKLHDAFIRNDSRPKPKGDTNPMDDGVLRMGEFDSAPNGPIFMMQQQFKQKGYSVLVDGKFGPGTRSTILAWKANNDRDTSTANMSKDDLAFLPDSPSMPVPLERASTTVEELKPNSTIIQKTSLGKQVLGWVGGTLGAGQLADSAGLLDQGQAYVDKAQQAKGIFVGARGLIADSGVGNLIQVILQWKFPILCIVVVVGFIILNQVQKKRLEMHQTAEIG